MFDIRSMDSPLCQDGMGPETMEHVYTGIVVTVDVMIGIGIRRE